MLHARATNDVAGSSTAGKSSSRGSSNDGGQLATVDEVAPLTQSRDSKFREATSISGLPLETLPPNGRSRDASFESAIDPIPEEKFPGRRRGSCQHNAPGIGSRNRSVWSKELTSVGDENNRDSMADEGYASSPLRKPAKRGLRTIIRRLFGRKLAKNRISMPAPAPAIGMANDPNTFITSAADLVPRRSTSAPEPPVSRSSALGSHAPTVISPPVELSQREKTKPVRPDRPFPSFLAQPRRASLSGAIANAKDRDAGDDARAGPGWSEGGDDGIDGANIGYAITSGSNPKRRSRSAGTLRDSSKEHRMSPIQWRQWRRRSDEIRYWRESAEEMSAAFDVMKSTGTPLQPSSSTRTHGEETTKDRASRSDDGRAAEDPDGNFDFGLPANVVTDPEHVGLEERMVTLEIKLMDFEYAISKLQAGLLSPQEAGPHEFSAENFPMSEASESPARPAIPRHHPRQPSQDSNYSVPMTPASPNPQASLRTPPFHSTGWHDPRPASVATTLKASSGNRGSRLTPTNLTIEHYTTLISLIRREQSARMRLEDEVSFLRQQLRLLNPPPVATFRDFSGRHAESPDVASGSADRRYRSRPREYDAETTDTDDASFHEVYVTPVERGELERAYLPAEEEGVAF